MFKVIRGGCETKHPDSFVMSRPKGLPNYLLLIVHSGGLFEIAGHHYPLSPQSALIITPNTPYSYTNPYGNYADDWLHFKLTHPEAASKFFPILNAPIKLNKTDSFTQLIRQILWENFYADSNFRQENLNALFTVFINHLRTACTNTNDFARLSPYQTQMQMLRLELNNSLHQKQSVTDWAQKIGISPSYFQHLYTDCFGISFQQDLIRMKIEKAKYNLITTDLTIEQIARLCGYTNEVHFYRQFKSLIGVTPTQYRKRHLL